MIVAVLIVLAVLAGYLFSAALNRKPLKPDEDHTEEFELTETSERIAELHELTDRLKDVEDLLTTFEIIDEDSIFPIVISWRNSQGRECMHEFLLDISDYRADHVCNLMREEREQLRRQIAEETARLRGRVQAGRRYK